MNENTMTFTPDKVKALRKAYAMAVETEAESFIFDGRELLTSYAKYLLEYLDMQFGKGR